MTERRGRISHPDDYPPPVLSNIPQIRFTFSIFLSPIAIKISPSTQLCHTPQRWPLSPLFRFTPFNSNRTQPGNISLPAESPSPSPSPSSRYGFPWNHQLALWLCVNGWYSCFRCQFLSTHYRLFLVYDSPQRLRQCQVSFLSHFNSILFDFPVLSVYNHLLLLTP